ncbi:hypothetical protein Tco_0851546 [Tanacetum coccineum]
MDCNRARHQTEYQIAREPEPARDPEPHNGPADAGSSCILYGMLSIIEMPPKRTTTTTTTPMSDVAIKELVARSVADVLVEHEANRSKNGDDNHDSETGSKRTERAARECTYSDFLKYQPLNFKVLKDLLV